jgi:hypothetical protein
MRPPYKPAASIKATEEGEVYVLCLHEPLSPTHARTHYKGFARNARSRIEDHARGRTHTRLIEVARERGIGFDVASIEPGTRQDERRLKNRGAGSRICPICRGGEPLGTTTPEGGIRWAQPRQG